MNRSIARIVLGLLLALFAAGAALAQPTDPALAKAKEETAAVYDLGRLFGYLDDMVKDGKTQALSADQLKKLYDIMVELKGTKRVEVARAKALLAQIEDRILAPAQLMAVDKLAAAAATQRSAQQGTGPGASGGVSPLQSWLNGGDFNPIVDATKPMGQDFQAFYQYAAKKLGK